MPFEHAFAPFLRAIGKGPNMSRPLGFDEARNAMKMILDGGVEPAQLGAFLLLLRYRGETGDEVAGLVAGVRDKLTVHGVSMRADLDWPSYADRHRQMPWYVLAALLLADNGIRVLMHGIEGESDGYAPTRPALASLGIAPAVDIAEAGRELDRRNFAYIGLETLAPELHDLFDLRPVLGLRTVANTLARAINPGNAAAQIVGVAHPPYMLTHQEIALRLGQPSLAVLKGGGGEAQRNPLKACRVAIVEDGSAAELEFPATLAGTEHDWRHERLDPGRVAALWRGDDEDPAPAAAVVATAAVALRALRRAENAKAADQLAADMWRNRNRGKFDSDVRLSA